MYEGKKEVGYRKSLEEGGAKEGTKEGRG